MNNRLTLVTIYVVILFTHIGFSMLFPVNPRYAIYVGASVSHIGLIVGTFAYVTALTMIPFGLLADRIGKRSLLLIGVTACIAVPWLYPQASTPSQLVLVIGLHGLATASFIPAANALLVDITPPPKWGRILGQFTAIALLGMAIGPAIGDFLLENCGFNTVFHTCSLMPIPGLLLIAIVFRRIPHEPSQAGRPTSGDPTLPRSSRGWLKSPAALIALLTPLFITVGSGTICAYMPLYADELGITWGGAAGFLIMALYGGSVVSRDPAGRISDKIGRFPVILFGFGISVISLACISMVTSFPALIVTTTFFGVGMGIAMPPGFALMADVAPAEMRGFGLGIANSSLQVGVAVGGSLMGLVVGTWGYEIMLYCCTLVVAIGMLIVLVLGYYARKKRQ